MAQTHQQLSRSRIRARNQHRYVFSLTNSKYQVQQRPKLTQRFNGGDFSSLGNLGNEQNHMPEARWRRKRRNVKLMIAVVMSGTILVFVMDSLLYGEKVNADFFQSTMSKDDFGKESSYVAYDSGGYRSVDTNQRHNRAIEGPQEHQYPFAKAREVDSAANPSQSSMPYDSIISDVSKIIREGSKKLEDIKLVVSFETPSEGLRKKPSGLRASPGNPLPDQEIELEKNRKYKPSKHLLSRLKTAPHEIAGLQCKLYGGPTSELETKNIIYWQEIKSDNKYMAPFFYRNKDITDDDSAGLKVARDSYTKYLTYEPDPGGFNNNRSAFERYLALSAAMGRTLVIPPKHRIPLLNKGTEKEQNLSMDDFFHLDSINKENVGVNIITMDEFLRREASSGHFTRYASDKKVLPPHNRTNWDGDQGPSKGELWDFLRSVGYKAEDWNNGCVGAFPSDAGGNKGLTELMNSILENGDGREFPIPLDYQGRPVPIQSPPIERLREILAGRRRLCLYDDEMQSATLVHFPSDKEEKLFLQFYAFLFFEDHRQATWIYRFIRDHLRYQDVIMCAAVRVIKEIVNKSISSSNPDGKYHSIHLRRTQGSFREKYVDKVLTTEDLMNSLTPIEVNSTLFISSDESPDHEIFQQLRDKYKVIFLADYHHLLEGLNPNFNGMIEQIIAARAELFFGTYYSTFSGYICRLRGYYAVRDGKDGHNEGKLTNTFYISEQHKHEYGIAKAVRKPFFAREFPIAWRDINKGI